MLKKTKKIFLLAKMIFEERGLKIIGGPSWMRRLGLSAGHVLGYYSQEGQDKYIDQLSKRLRIEIKSILDVGCNDPIKYNNSYYFERQYKSRVYGIDAIDHYKNLWCKHRPNAVFIKAAVGEKAGNARFYVNKSDDMFSSLKKNGNKTESDACHYDVEVHTLDRLMKEMNIGEIDFLSMDVEGYEFSAIKGMDLKNNRPKIMLIENNSDDLRMGDWGLRNYIRSHNYVMVGRVWGLDDVYVDEVFIKNKKKDKN